MFGFHAAPDAKYWRHLWSVQANIIGAAFAGIASILGVFGAMPWVQDHPYKFAAIAAVVNMVAIVGRLVDQGNVPDA